jgi:predicted GNAT family N-acyltransferase
MKITFNEIAHKSPEWISAVKLREKTLRKPLGSRFTDQELEEEKYHFQIVGCLDNTIIATAVLVPEGDVMKMQRVVVTEALRSKKIGSKMIAFIEKFAVDRDFISIYCHARDSAVKFYIKNGYEGVGDYFDEDGIPHLKMNKTVANTTLPKATAQP